MLHELIHPQDLMSLLAFLGTGCAVWLMLSWWARRSESRVEDRLTRLSRAASQAEIQLAETSPSQASVPTLKMQELLQKAAAFSQPLMPKSELEQNKLRLKLANAGFRHESAVSVFIGLKFLSLLLGAALGAVTLLPTVGLELRLLQWLAVFAGVGLFLPDVLLWWLVKKRQEQIFLTLPDVLDLLVVCVESGLGLDAAMRRVVEEMKPVAPAICDELAVCNFQMQVGRPRRDVLHDLGVRTGVDDVRSLVAILIQAERFGSSVAQALRVQSDAMRTRRRQLAEERAQKTAVKLIFPLVLFIFPGVFVVLVGPAGIQIYNAMLK
ncbi:MAG: type II secretion system F family protein [Gemmatales bacterium]|nr:type II secretion system F family protein [Gemmatales bacterium]MCS7161091.1 type II secretion system F family protein [Gemmatales bacterium]MDW8176294.1 type II secretion system F family protein [Gemmatales bacterium]MDW8223190.1 type II secretion system F family protein [Gemmatales bacterium]